MRRITLICKKNHKEEVVISSFAKIKRCYICKGSREVIWDGSGPTAAPAFRVQGCTKNFR